MRKNKAILLFVLLVAVLSVLPAASSVISRPAATVNLIRNHMISEAELETEYQNYVNMGAQGITRMDVLNTLINNEVFLQGAERDGITVSDRQLDQLYAQARANASAQAGRTVTDEEFAAEATRQFGSVDAYRQALREQYIVNQYVLMSKGAELQNIPMPTDAEISSFYRQNQQAFFQAENVKLAHIYIPKTGDAAEDQASRELLEKVVSDIHSGAITFERAVSEYSQDNSSKNIGGDIGWLTADNTTARQGWGDAFCDAVLSMQPGDVSDVMESNMGYHIVKVSVHNYGKILSLNDPVSPEDTVTVRDYISQVLYMNNSQVAMANAIQEILQELRAEAQIRILYEENNAE